MGTEAKITPQNPEIAQSTPLEIPRDRRGRIRWTLPGNTMEENLELGIRNIQLIFLAKYSDFDTKFPRLENGQVADKSRGGAADFIAEKLSRREDFKALFGPSALHKRVAPYFSGRHQLILQTAFERWGLDLQFQTKPNNYWTEARIRDEAQHFLESTNILSEPALKRQERGDLVIAVRKRYKGGLRKLRQDIGTQDLRKPKGYWTVDRIEEETLAFWQNHGIVSEQSLTEHGMTALVEAIKKYYPGHFSGIITNLQIEGAKKPVRYWTPENIEKEASKFYLQYGDINQRLLQENGKSGLASAISTKYQGGLVSLRENLGFSNGETAISPNQANEQLRRLLE